uniref:Receptor expression-enhancing protein n=1 Tax=Eutreptiella gymnastica TaxID=73025 RepID=A0A7S4CZJ3_9EUGL
MILGHGVTRFFTRCLLLAFGFKSWKSLDSEASAAQSHWLTFWLLYAFVQAAECVLDNILYRAPMYFELKLAFFVYLGLFNGATTIYEKFGANAIQSAEKAIKQVSEKEEVQKFIKQVQEKAAPILEKIPKRE